MRKRQAVEPRVPGRLEAEAVALGLLTLAAFLEVALLSHYPQDPWWGVGEDVQNLCGPVGATLARAGIGTLGLAAHVLPLGAVVGAVRYLRGLRMRPRWVPALAWTTSWVTLAGLFEVVRGVLPGWVPANAGGVVGEVLVGGLAALVYLPGTALLLTIAFCVALLVATGGSVRNAGFRGIRSGARLGRALTSRAVVLAVRLRRRWEKSAQEREKTRRIVDLERSPTAKVPSSEPEVVEHRVEAPRPVRQASLPLYEGSRGPFRLPEIEFLARGSDQEEPLDREMLIRNSRIVEKKLADFSVDGQVVKVHPGPVITMYEFEPAPGIKVSRIVNLADDLALALRALSVRIVAPIPGKSVVGVEVPNAQREVVLLRDLLSHPSYYEASSKLTLPLGKDIFGNPVVSDLTQMPHLLVAGATGTGKSVFLNALLCSIFFKATPNEVKLLLIDPKLLEFSIYEGIPHLISEVVTNPKRAAAALMGVVAKMEERYRLMADRGVRNIEQYNKAVASEGRGKGEEEVAQPLPYIVVVIDELADLMIVSARDVEESLTRLAQMARAAGIHLVLATQRPSVDVITGLIKANFPARISFQVSSRTDARTVMDANGAERLLGMGDMLFLPPGTSKLTRIHGPYISEKEVRGLTDFLREQGPPALDPTILRLKEESARGEERGDDFDELYDEAVALVARHRIASISFVQRKLKIGYNRAARLVEQMEGEGVVGPQEGTRAREIFVRPIED
ncbi:MAG: DNA translocase FtsK 4TM domain-containing protein [Myxococcota bacterium]